MTKTENCVFNFFVYAAHGSFKDEKRDDKHKLGFSSERFFMEIFLDNILSIFSFDN